MGGLSNPFFLGRSLLLFARRTSVVGTLLPTGLPLEIFGQRFLSINLDLTLLYVNSGYST
jgi:hypothetical protein